MYDLTKVNLIWGLLSILVVYNFVSDSKIT